MRKISLYIKTTVIVASLVLLCGAVSNGKALAASNDDNPGDIVDNPWADMFKDVDDNGDLIIDIPEETTTVKVDIGDSSYTVEGKIKSTVKIKSAIKKKSSKKLTVKISKIKNVTGYQISVYTKKANAKKNKKAIVKKEIKKNIAKLVIKNKKFTKKKKIFVRVRAYKITTGNKVMLSKWSKIKKVKLK